MRLTVIDVQGHRVARLFEGPQEAGAHALVWTGRGEDGEPLSAGVYRVRLQTERGERTRRVAFVH